MKNTKLLRVLLTVAQELGTVKCAHLYENGYMSVEGMLPEGAAFSLQFCLQEAHHG